jgi:hypothetical protein
MIRVKRAACPLVLQLELSPESKGESETRRNIAGGGSRVFNAYADKAVRKTLKAMFHGKCAYCESRITTIYSGDIEHFRPKGGGYYWLAADWDNLLFACPFCNQTHTHEFTVNGQVEEAVRGKRDQFPLMTEEYRLKPGQAALFMADREAYRRAFEAEEGVRLLLSPCTDKDIEKYFVYGDQGVILVAAGLNGFERRRAETSITTYALQRLGLVMAREARLLQIKAQIRRVEEAIKDFDAHFDALETERSWYEGVLRAEMELLSRFQDPDQEYAGLARDFIGRYFRESGFA